MTFLRTIYLIGLAICFGLASNFAFSQDAPTQAQNAPAAAQASTPVPNSSQPAKSAEELAAASEAALKSKLTSSEIDSGAIDLDDPALQEAINAKRAADQALVDAVIKARETAAAAQLESGVSAVEDTQSAIASKIPKSVDEVKEISRKILNKLIGWLTSPAFLAQLGAIALVWFLAPIFTRMMTKRIFLFRDPPETTAKFYKAREYVYRSREFLRAIWQVALLALFAVILKAVPALGQDWLVKIAQGLAVVFLLYSVIKTFITHEMVQKLAIWIIIPLALLMVFGFYDDLTDWLNNMKFGAGEDAISAMTIVMLAIFGAIFFKAATYSNVRGQGAIRAQKSLDITTREVLAKIFQIIVFVLAGIMAFTAAGISLSGLVVVFSALSLGLGLGLQPIAANFVSGMIILFDRSVKVGDFVMMEDEKFGRVSAINMRSTTVATADGKDIIVPNTSFTEGAYENWTHDSPLQRYEVDFCVAYDTDIDALIPIIQNAVLAHEDVLGEPDLPSIEFRSFGENGINMCAEFWCLGVDDGPNKFTSDVGILIWRTLRDNKIVIPYPQRVVRTVK